MLGCSPVPTEENWDSQKKAESRQNEAFEAITCLFTPWTLAPLPLLFPAFLFFSGGVFSSSVISLQIPESVQTLRKSTIGDVNSLLQGEAW